MINIKYVRHILLFYKNTFAEFLLEVLLNIFVGQFVGVKGIVLCYISGLWIYSNYFQRNHSYTWETTKWSAQD